MARASRCGFPPVYSRVINAGIYRIPIYGNPEKTKNNNSLENSEGCPTLCFYFFIFFLLWKLTPESNLRSLLLLGVNCYLDLIKRGQARKNKQWKRSPWFSCAWSRGFWQYWYTTAVYISLEFKATRISKHTTPPTPRKTCTYYDTMYHNCVLANKLESLIILPGRNHAHYRIHTAVYISVTSSNYCCFW